MRHFYRYFFIGMSAIVNIPALYANGIEDSIRIVDIEDITVIASPKEHTRLRVQPLASTLFGIDELKTNHIESVKGISNLTPNLFIPEYGSSLTSAIYIRGIGSRINTPAVGLYVDNIPYIDKSAFDFNFIDIERVDVLRGPQGTLYGRNTMGGLIRIHTHNPFRHQGTEIRLSAANANNSGKLSFIHRGKQSERLAYAIGGYLHESRGFFQNIQQNRWTDNRRSAGAYLRTIYRPTDTWRIDLTASYDYTDEGGYSYRYIGDVTPENETYPTLKGFITNNRPNGYWRSLVNTGINMEWQADRFTLHSVTGYQHLNDCMTIDQDFLAADIFTLKQRQKQHTLSQEFSLKSHPGETWKHTTGISGFYQWLNTQAPVTFYADGISMIQEAMDEGMANSPVKVTLTDSHIRIPGIFETPTTGIALFHQSDINLLPQLTLTAGLRLDYEYIYIDYNTHATINGKMSGMGFNNQAFKQTIEYINTHHKDHLHILPKIALTFTPRKDSQSNLYASFSKGLRSGGYNIQMFSEIIQESFRKPSSNDGKAEAVNDRISYSPEYSWNYEVGTHLALFNNQLQADAAFFYIDTHDQQISRFTSAGLGRVMINAGRGESYGFELSLRSAPLRDIALHLNYGYTHATFRNYDGGFDKEQHPIDYSGNHIPYIPSHTLNIGGCYTIQVSSSSWINSVALRADYTGAGDIYWTEQNNARQDFYGLVNANISCHLQQNIQVDCWCRNLFNHNYDTFYFESMNRGFAQKGHPRQIGLDIRFKF